jgi:hypothetical protein
VSYGRNARIVRRRMSSSKAALNRPSWTTPPEPEAVYSTPPAPIPSTPIENPVIQPQQPKWYRVMRAVKSQSAGLSYECIGEFPTLSAAVVFAGNEKFRAIVNGWNGQRHYDSWRQFKVIP